MYDAAEWAESEAILSADPGDASSSWKVSPISARGRLAGERIPDGAAILSRPISCAALKRHVGDPFEDA